MGVSDEVLKTNKSYAKDFKCERANEDWREPLDLEISAQDCRTPVELSDRLVPPYAVS